MNATAPERTTDEAPAPSARFDLYEVDTFYNVLLDRVGTVEGTQTDARREARKHALAWCEDETPGLLGGDVPYEFHFRDGVQRPGEIVIGDCDFGIAIIRRDAKKAAGL